MELNIRNRCYSISCACSGPSALSNFLWSVATPIQTSVLGHLEDDAIAANSVATTIYQYVKIIAIGEARRVRGHNRQDYRRKSGRRHYNQGLQPNLADYCTSFSESSSVSRSSFCESPFLSLYDLSDNALRIADGMLMCCRSRWSECPIRCRRASVSSRAAATSSSSVYEHDFNLGNSHAVDLYFGVCTSYAGRYSSSRC